ncbi:MAG: polyprenyl synthetase family protein [Actinomycetia bacterium]|nr:polyprenyl synthetase family protein [Actinomycetes bacterium]
MEFKAYLSRNAKRMDKLVVEYFNRDSNPDIMRYLYQPLATYTSNGGKRHRPLICELACQAVGGDPECSRSPAAAIEYFHTAALIHDDIADRAELRRGQPALHKVLGEGLAINSGDLALSQVTGVVLKDQQLADAVKLRVLKELVAMTEKTIEGQAMDIGWSRDGRFDVTIDDYLVMATHKTAFYSGGVPLAVGAIVGGGSEAEVEALRDYGIATGLAFQIQDDLLNLIGKQESTKKDFRSDITEGKRTLITVHALQHSSRADELVGILTEHTDDPTVLARAVELLLEAGSLDYAHHYAIGLVHEAQGKMRGLIPQSIHRDLLLSMADFFVERMS